MKNLYVVAHTQSEHHVRGLVGGWYDTSLTDLGRDQAARVAARLADLIAGAMPVELFASDLRRAAETAAVIGERLGVAVNLDADLRERSYGSAGGQPSAWLEQRFVPPPRTNGRLDHRDGIADAESKREFITRVYRATQRIIDRDCATQVVITHGFAMTFVVSAWIGLALEDAAYVSFKSTPGGITHLFEDDELHNRSVMRLNDTTHMGR